MIDAAVLRAMAAAGATTEVIIAAVEAAQAADEARKAAKRAGNAERQRRFKEKRRVRRDNAGNALPRVTPPIEELHTPGSVVSPDGEKQNTPRAERAAVSIRPEDIPQPLWSAWVAHRRKHKADASETTLAAYRREAVEVGWTLEQVLTEQIARGWRGFKAKWVIDDGRSVRTGGNAGPAGGGGRGGGDGFTRALDHLDEALRGDHGLSGWPADALG